MEFRHIRSFLSVAETLHFGRSARLLNLSQPALSLQVKALEDELGIQLLSRNRQGTVLTAAGQAFREDAAVALESSNSQSGKLSGRQQASLAIFVSALYQLPVLRSSRT
jgi:DNA-binding transcriptional LysR family regulator